jgi:hypothetical protein
MKDQRLARIESRLVQLMLFLGANPYGANHRKRYRPLMSKRVKGFTLTHKGVS